MPSLPPRPLVSAVSSPVPVACGQPPRSKHERARPCVQLRTAAGQRGFNSGLAAAGYDLASWRASQKARLCDFSLLDRNDGAGWDLACKLVRKRGTFNRGRLSAAQALRHRFFLPEL